MGYLSKKHLIVPTPQDMELARDLLENLSDKPIEILSSTGATFSLPEKTLTGFKNLLSQIAKGNAVSVIGVSAELSTHQAAELLNVSRPYLIKLLALGVLPYRKVGSHRRIQLQPLLEYKAREDALANRALDEMVSISEELGLYD
jgi:excisionase family DNA binding protein